MKLLIASDIHGAADYCQLLLQRFQEEGAERLLLLGDLLYHGPRNDLPPSYDPKAVAEMLNQNADKLLCVRGNCDTEVDQMVLQFPIMAEYALLYSEGYTLLATHGHHLADGTVILPAPGSIVLYGHTHVPTHYTEKGCLYINPGSVSIPKQQSLHSYIVYQDACFTWKDLKTQQAYDSYRI